MKQFRRPSTDCEDLRRRAEERLKGRKAGEIPTLRPKDSARLFHELQIREIELEIQNEELRKSHEALEAALKEYTDLYDSSLAGYFMLDSEGIIRNSNLAGATLLGMSPSQLINLCLSSFIAEESQSAFNAFLLDIFSGEAKAACDVALRMQGPPMLYVHMDGGIVHPGKGSERLCRVMMTDISERKQIENVQLFLVNCGNAKSGEDYFRSLAQYLAESLDMDYVCIDRLEGQGQTAKTVAVYYDGHFEDDVTYTLNDTPCGKVVGNVICCYPRDVRHLFPQDAVLQEMNAESYVGTTLWGADGQPIGLIALIGRHPLTNSKRMESVLRLVVLRAAHELERKISEESLIKERANLQAVFDMVNVGMLLIDEAGVVQRVNNTLARWLNGSLSTQAGSQPGDYIGCIHAIAYPEKCGRTSFCHSCQIRNTFEWVLRTGKPIHNVETEASLSVDGQKVDLWIEISADPLLLDGKQHVILAMNNITGLHKAEEALRKSEAFKQAILNSLTVHIAVLDRTGQIIISNALWKRFSHENDPTGMAATGEGVNYLEVCRRAADMHDPLAREALEGIMAVLAGDATQFVLEYPCHSPLEQRWFLMTVTPTVNTGGAVISHADITWRKQAEEALQRNRDRSALLAETMGALLQSTDPQQQVEPLCVRVMAHLDCQVFFNYLVDAATGRLHLNAYAGIPAEEAAKIEWLDYGVSVCGCVALERCRIVAEHIPSTHDPRTNLVHSFGVKAYACYPLIGPGNDLIGTLSFGTCNRETIDEDDLSLMKSVVDRVAIAMERVNSEHALRHAHEELERRVDERTADLHRMSLYVRSLIEAGLDPLVTINPEGEITDVNRATELATGLLRAELIGSDFSEYFTEPDKAREGYQRVLAEGQVTDYPLTIRHTSGSMMDVLYHATIYRDEAGEVQGVFAAARDVTERKRIEQALRDSEKLLADAHRIARLGGWDWNIVADELTWSDEMFRLFGFEPQAFPVNYARFLECIHPEDRDLVITCVNRALEGSDNYNVRYRILQPDTTERILSAQAEVMFDKAGVPLRMTGTVLDITEQVRAEEEAKLRLQQLLQADKMISLGILVSGVAHEINNPNHSILSNVTLLKDVWEDARPILEHFYEDFGDFVLGGLDYSEYRDKFLAMYAGALSSSERIRVIVEELRDFARSNPNEKMTDVNIDVVVESACILMANMIHKSTDHYEINHAANLPPVRANFQRIEQVVINLIQNACRSLPSRNKGIRVNTVFAPESKQVLIEVCDEGVGIAEKDQKHLGDPFFTTQRAAGGMGLGLWVSFNIVHEHGGTLTYYSEPGQGTRAVLALPVNEDFNASESHPQTRKLPDF